MTTAKINDDRTAGFEDLLFEHTVSEARTAVIEASVMIERVLTRMLCKFLSIDLTDSRSFSTEGLSFNAKLNLLADSDLISKEEKTKLVKFSEIRNLFAHESHITTFSRCFDLNNTKAFLTRRYGDTRSVFDIEEDNNRLLFQKLYDDIKDICRGLYRTMTARVHQKGHYAEQLIFLANLQTVLARLSSEDPHFRCLIDAAYGEAGRLSGKSDQ